MKITLLSIEQPYADWLRHVCAFYGFDAIIEVDEDYMDYIDDGHVLYNAELDGDNFHIEFLKNSFNLLPVHHNSLKEGMQFNMHEVGQVVIE